MSKNLITAQQTLGDKSIEAGLALEGSMVGLIGGAIGLVGVALESLPPRVQTGNLITSTSHLASRSAVTADLAIRVGGVVVALTAFYDAAQANSAASRAALHGDFAALGDYRLSTATSVLAGVVGVIAGALKATALTGLVGAAVGLGLLAYYFYARAHGNESSPLELWCKRCFFGFANERAKTHWDSSKYSVVAFSELNAITVGLEAALKINFEHVGYSPGNIPIARSHWFYRLRLPYYDAARSAYQWALVVHRDDEGLVGEDIAGKIVERVEFQVPIITTPAQDLIKVLMFQDVVGVLDYEANNNARGGIIQSMMSEGETQYLLEVKGSVTPLPRTGKSIITGFTLILTYWPDRQVEAAFAEVVVSRRLEE